MNTDWMGQYRGLVEKIIHLCNKSATHFNVSADYNTPIKITAHQIQVIEYLLEGRDEKMSDVAKRLGVSRGTFSGSVSKLISMGCLEKKHVGNNKKNLYLSVTPLGHKVYSDYSKFIYSHWFKDMFAMADQIPPEYIKIFENMLKGFADTLVE